jgi:hypothetical protein
MGKLDQLAELRRNGPKARRAAPPAKPPKSAKNGKEPSATLSVDPDHIMPIALLVENQAAWAALPQPPAPNLTLAEAITAALAKAGKKGVVSTAPPTECPQCAKRRKAKARSMQRYRAKIAKKAKRAKK